MLNEKHLGKGVKSLYKHENCYSSTDLLFIQSVSFFGVLFSVLVIVVVNIN